MLFKTAGAIVLWIKNNERHRLVGAEKKLEKKNKSTKSCAGRSEVAKSPCAREGGASIGDRLALDDSAIDGHTQNGNIGKR